jgi:hypothetical protein
MKKVNFEKNFTTTIGGFFQYDYGQIIDVYNTGTNIENLQFEFIQDGQQITVLGNYTPETNSYHVRIPDTFLQRASEILTYIYYEDEEKGQTIKIIIIRISAREKFEDIPDPEHKGVVEQILEMIAHLQDEIDNWTISEEQLEAIVQEVEAQIDLNDYYDKEEVDNLLENKADKSEIPDISGLATKTELNNGLSTKADKTDTYTKTEVDNLIPDVSGFATKTELGNLSDSVGQALSGISQGLNDTNNRVSTLETDKADKSTTYTKTEVDTLLNAKADTSDLPDMTNYYTKSETYSKTEIDNILGNIESILEEI